MKNLIFLFISLAILLFSIIVTNITPIIIGKVGSKWSFYACKLYSEYYDSINKSLKQISSITQKEKDAYLDPIKKEKTRCDRRKAMNGLEYVISNLNIIFGFICAFAGFLLYKNIGNLGSDGKYIGLIGLGCGVVGFVLTLVYVIESCLVFTDVDSELKDSFDINIYNSIIPYNIRIDSDGTFLEWDNDKKRYNCIYYKEDDEYSLYLKFSDYNNKYLNYYKDIEIPDNKKYYMYRQCRSAITSKYDVPYYCEQLSEKTDEEIDNSYDYILKNLVKKMIEYSSEDGKIKGDCEKIYFYDSTKNNDKKIIYDYWLTSLIFSCLIMLLHLGLALFGFLLFKKGGSDSSGSSSSPITIK